MKKDKFKFLKKRWLSPIPTVPCTCSAEHAQANWYVLRGAGDRQVPSPPQVNLAPEAQGLLEWWGLVRSAQSKRSSKALRAGREVCSRPCRLFLPRTPFQGELHNPVPDRGAFQLDCDIPDCCHPKRKEAGGWGQVVKHYLFCSLRPSDRKPLALEAGTKGQMRSAETVVHKIHLWVCFCVLQNRLVPL